MQINRGNHRKATSGGGGFYFVISRNFFYFKGTCALVKFLHQMTNSVARSKPFQGNNKYETCVQFYNLTRVTKGNIALK